MLAAEYVLHLFHWLWQGWVVGFVALTVVRMAPRTSARFRSAILLVAIIKCLLPPMLPVRVGLFSRVPLFGVSLLGNQPAYWLLLIGTALALIHAIGAIVRLFAFVRSHRELRHGIPDGRRIGRVRVVVVPAGCTIPPLTFGWIRPVIVLPAEVALLGRRERRVVFAHERSHIERAHGLVVVVEELFAALAWMQPMLRRVIDERRRVREELCDRDAVLRLRVAPADYATSLLAVAARCAAGPRHAGAIAATATAAALRARFHALVRRSRWSPAEIAAVVLISMALLPGIQPR